MIKTNKHTKNQLLRLASISTVGVAILLILIKLVSYLLTGSVAILSSLFDSIQDCGTSIVSFIAIRHSLCPADKEHQFGHGKAQAIGCLVQVVIIVLSALFLLKESICMIFNPSPITHYGFGAFSMVLVLVFTVGLVMFQSYVIKKTNSMSIKAEKAHYVGDIAMNVGVILALSATYFFDIMYIDAIFGIGVSGYLFLSSWHIYKDCCNVLMDAQLPESVCNKITDIVASHKMVKKMHHLKTRQSGDNMFIQFCITLDKTLNLQQAHLITEEIEHQLHQSFQDMEVLIHYEPDLGENP